MSVARPFVREIVLTTYGPRFLVRRVTEGAYDVVRLLRSLPSDIRELSRTMRENRFRIVLDHIGWKEQTQAWENASKRLSVSIVIASLVLGSSLMAQAHLEPKFFGVPVIALAGFAIAGALGLWLVFSAYFTKGS